MAALLEEYRAAGAKARPVVYPLDPQYPCPRCPLGEHVEWLRFDLYAPAPADPSTEPERPDPVAAEVARQAELNAERGRHRH
ncbi:hypothetical protein ACIBCA_09575 [Kitasatospora sp. NPDC051170]|uniref:hypothetical protein n=1 Tax=Kitasatospora sp. NPDC051170 TaxID=3364056 RepID=UPI0037951EFE